MYYGLDVHKDFTQVCVLDKDGNRVREFKCPSTREAVTAFAKSVEPKGRVVLEATFHSWPLWKILTSNGVDAVVANPIQVKAIAHAKIKTDKVDARILAQLLRAGFVPEVEMPDEVTWELRQLNTQNVLAPKNYSNQECDSQHLAPETLELLWKRALWKAGAPVARKARIFEGGETHPRQ